MKKYFVSGLLIVCSLALHAQDTNQNFVKTTTYKTATTAPYANPTAVQAQVNVTYLDGLGRPVLQVAGKQSGNDKDVVGFTEYDDYGRQAVQYLPYVASTNNLQFATKAQALTGLDAQPEYAGQQAFSQSEYENSPLSRVLKQSAPGTADSWAMGSGHEVKYDYLTATLADKVKILSVASGTITSQSYFMVNLYKNTITDEDGNKTETFTDSGGRMILKRNFLAGLRGQVTLVDTYYLYDERNNLAYVIPPAAAATLTGTALLDNLCYQYKYDDDRRLIGKKEPGKEWEYIVYDKLNRIVAVGPAYSPFGSDETQKGWLFSFYDAVGRICYTGWQQHAFTENSRQALQNNYNGGVTVVTKTASDNTIDGLLVRYSSTGLPSGLKLLTVNYYDNYEFPGFAPTVFPSNAHYNLSRKPIGLATGSWSRILVTGTIKGEYSYVLYDYRGQPVLTAKKNHLDKTTQVSSLLDFTGKPQTVTTVQQPLSGATNLTILEAFTYTNQGQLLRHTHKNNTDPVQLLAYNKYNNLGQLVTKMVGDVDLTGNSALQKVDYSYNIRGWLKGINNVNDLNPVTQPGAFNDLFALGINYNDNEVDLNESTYDAKKLYNGNISEILWRSSSDNQLRKYGYSYDRLGRMLDAVYQKPEADTPWRGSYDERMRYDINGNITSVQRHGNLDTQSPPLEIDNLQYYYAATSNKLLKVHDYSNSTQGFKDNTGSVGQPPTTDPDHDYKYDNKGNQTFDKNKGISSITYNHLNLPVEITFNNNANTKITYLYTASGQKVQKAVKQSAGAAALTNYISGFQYKNTTLDFFPVSGGYVKNTVLAGVNYYNYVFHYLDHLGNIRLSYAKNVDTGVKILEENHYYPYGLKHTNYNTDLNAFKANEMETAVVLKAEPVAASYPYKFNGMEWQDELGLNLYDMDLRDYDPAIGRWTGIDPVTHFSQSPYNAFDANPVSIADPSGADGVSPEGINTWHYAGAGSMNGFLNGGAGNLGNGDHMHGGSGNSFWMGQGAITGGIQGNPFSFSGNNLNINWNRVSDGTKWNVASDNVYLWHEDSVTYNGEFTLGEGGRLDSVNMGYWEKLNGYDQIGKAVGHIDSMINIGILAADNFGDISRWMEYSKYMGLLGKISGRLANAANGYSVYLDYQMTRAKINSPLGFTYRTIGTGTSVASSIAIGATYGGPWGAFGGAIIGLGFSAVEASFNIIAPQIQSSYNHFINSITNQWMSYR